MTKFPPSVLALVLAAAAPGASAALRAQAVSIPLSPYVEGITTVQAQIKGEAGRFIFDTGGGVTMLTPHFASQIGCVPWGKITGFRMRGDRLDTERCDNVVASIEEVPLPIATAGIWDFDKTRPPSVAPVDGSLAMDAFVGKVITLDLAAGHLTVESDASLKERVAHAVEVPARFGREAGGLSRSVFIGVDTEKGRLWMELDSGSDGAITLGNHAADVMPSEKDQKGRSIVSLHIPGIPDVKGSAVVRDLIMDGNLGVPVLRRWVVTIDLARERLWIAPRPEAEPTSK